MITTARNASFLVQNGQRLPWRYEFALGQSLYNRWGLCTAKAGDLSTPGTIINLNKSLGASDAEIIDAIESEIENDARLRGMIKTAEAARKARVAQLAALKAAPEDSPEWRQEVVDLEISLRRNGEHISGT